MIRYTIHFTTPTEERVLDDLAAIAGGEHELELVLRQFVEQRGRAPDGPELLRAVAAHRLARMRAEDEAAG